MNDNIPATVTEGALTTPQSRQWALLIHLSQLAGWVIPIAGWAVPIVLWQLKKEELPEIDAHGKMVANWLISELVYGVIFGLLSMVLIGIPLLFALVVVGTIFPVIGAAKSQKGELWRYPLSFKILR